ncbi:fibulin-1-like [Salarias fasciatus]|uniref:fibulin-1-like n=1 Tax=Salarias fasciatus TaxID=181472 RepID=UPI0011767506|nr:fibulin-1-like [Salarias fasciatus]
MARTALWITVLLSLHGALQGYGTEPPTLLECCELGKNKGEDEQDCTVHPLISSHLCTIVYEQCCFSIERGLLCEKGIAMARRQGACERPYFEGYGHETQTSKMCCDCCSLGLTLSKSGVGCHFKELFLGSVCTSVAHSCCFKNSTAGLVDKVPTVSPEEVHGCADSLCSQLCIDDGVCSCYDGFALQNDGLTCKDINECQTGSHICSTGYICINTEGSFRCQKKSHCSPGYALIENICKDIDECKLGTHHCGPSFVCINIQGSFSCLPKDKCAPGYTLDDIGACIDLNECVEGSNPCPPGETCINNVGSFICRSNAVVCGPGYHLIGDGRQCEDIDECEKGDLCGIHRCVNLVGSFRCECLPGFSFNSITKLCDDINECGYHTKPPCAQRCENVIGTFRCRCNIGFKLANDSKNCEDIDECEVKPCSQECTNVFGSFQCQCRQGFQLSATDRVTCEDIDECALSGEGKVCPYRCINSPGGFNCTCPPRGFISSDGGQKCQDIDECKAGTHTCSPSERCFNVQGGFRCLSFTCPVNFRQASKVTASDDSPTVRCIKDCMPHDRDCLLNPIHLVTHSVLSLPTFRDCSKPEEIALLRTTTQANLAHSNATDVFFVLLSMDERFSFDIVKRTKFGKHIGVIRQLKPIIGPRNIVLEVSISYVTSGVVTHINIVVIHVFICEYWF